jgi:hypothetical protein
VKVPSKSSCVVIHENGDVEVHFPKYKDEQHVNRGSQLMLMCAMLLSDSEIGKKLRAVCEEHLSKH